MGQRNLFLGGSHGHLTRIYTTGSDEEREFGWTRARATSQLLQLLRVAAAAKDKVALSRLLQLAWSLSISADYRDTLVGLLEADWHASHEDVVDLLAGLRDPSLAPVLYRMALRRLPSRAWDDGRALERKCMFALRELGAAGIEQLAHLARSDDPFIVSEAMTRLREIVSSQKKPSDVRRLAEEVVRSLANRRDG